MRLPVFPLHTVLLPGVPLPLRIFEQRYLRMLADRAAHDPVFAVSLISSGREVGDQPAFQSVGTLASLSTVNTLAENLVELVVVGGNPVRLGLPDWARGYAESDCEELPESPVRMAEFRRLARQGWDMFGEYARQVGKITGHTYSPPSLQFRSASDAAAMTYDLASRLPCSRDEQQRVLEERDPLARMESLNRIIERELALLTEAGVVGAHLGQAGSRFSLN